MSWSWWGAAAAREALETLTRWSTKSRPTTCGTRFVIGTPDEVAAALWRVVGWGASHLIWSLGAEMFMLWPDSTLELFVHEVLPRARSLQAN
jgi:alkanesulfonate monooxygenase SsuD/methylene tetrahydromethanopterin reductase-like flavin-dependent oxidoreductase (luciferase family)